MRRLARNLLNTKDDQSRCGSLANAVIFRSYEIASVRAAPVGIILTIVATYEVFVAINEFAVVVLVLAKYTQAEYR